MKYRLLWIFGFSSSLLANPTHPVVVEGAGSFSHEGPLLEVTAQDRTIIDWESFSIAPDETTRFIQPDAYSSVLNRVTGFTPSLIDGALEANGKVILVNPQGVIVGKSGTIHASEFVASTFDLVDKETWALAKADTPRLSMGKGAINMDGMIHASSIREENGAVLLVAESVSVSGKVEAPAGRIEVLGDHVQVSEGALLDASGARRGGEILIGGDYQGSNPLILNSRTLVFEAGAKIGANAIEEGPGGRVILWSDEGTLAHGAISARGAGDGDGGFVEISSKGPFAFASAVDTRSPFGKTGMLLLDPCDITISTAATAPLALATPVFNPATAGVQNIMDTDLSMALNGSDVTILTSAGSGGNGDITFLDGANLTTVPWNSANTLTLTADRNINITPAAAGIQIVNAGTGNIVFSAPSGSITVGDTAATAATSIITSGNISFTAGNGLSIIGGNGGGTVAIDTTINTGAIDIEVSAGNLVLSSLTGDNLSIGSNVSGPISIDAAAGNIFLNADNNAIVSILTGDFFDFSAAQNIQIFSLGGGFVDVNCTSSTGTPSFIDVGVDFLCDATGSGDYEIGFQNSFLTANIGRDLSIVRSSSSDGGIIPLGLGGVMNIGRDLTLASAGTGVSQINSNGPLTLNVGNNALVQNTGPARALLISASDFNFILGNNLLVDNPSLAGFPNAVVGSGTNLNITAGGSVELSQFSFFLGGFFAPGTVTVIADQNITIGPMSGIGFNGFGMLGQVTLVVDNEFPSAPQIGSGAFIMDPTAEINPGGTVIPVQIFTARQSQNSILGLINSASFVPGAFNVDTSTEHWRVYYPDAFIGSPFTIFYKEPQIAANAVSAISQQVGGVFDLIEEFTAPVPYYDDLFCVKYQGDDFGRELFGKTAAKPLFNVDSCPWIQVNNYRKYYPSLQRWGYTYPVN